MYKVENPYNKFLSYTYTFNNEKEVSFMFLKSTPKYSEHALDTANDVIMAWTDYAKEALEGEYRESQIPCWHGHYQQFGRLMYHLLDVCSRKECYLQNKRFSKQQLDFFPTKLTLEYIEQGPTSSEDRIFYRCWFNLIGHSDFIGVAIDGIESHTYVYWKYVFSCLALELGNSIFKQRKGEIEFLHAV